MRLGREAPASFPGPCGRRPERIITSNYPVVGISVTKYTSVSIPLTLHKRLEKLISKKTGFKSVSDYVTYVLREVVAMHELKEVPEPFTSTDLDEIKKRLQALGYL
jgi:Arc/MetJ-type ribon-helix-helix transcriptional regulator